VLHISNFKIYSNFCVQHFHSIICRFSKWSLLSYSLKHGVAHNPVWRYGQLNFVPVSLFMAEHTWHLMLTLNKPASVVNFVECFWVSHAWGLSSLYCSLWSRHPSRLLYQFPHQCQSNCQCDDFEPQKVRLINLLRMVRCRG